MVTYIDVTFFYNYFRVETKTDKSINVIDIHILAIFDRFQIVLTD